MSLSFVCPEPDLTIEINNDNASRARELYLDYIRPLKLFPFIISTVYTLLAVLFFGMNDLTRLSNTFIYTSLWLPFILSSIFVFYYITNIIHRNNNTFSVRTCKKICNGKFTDFINKSTDDGTLSGYILVIFIIVILVIVILVVIGLFFGDFTSILVYSVENIALLLLISSASTYLSCLWFLICNKFYHQKGKYRFFSLKELCALSALYNVLLEDFYIKYDFYYINKKFTFDYFMQDKKVYYYICTYVM